MIKKYLDFLNESIDLILESDVVYSDNFRKAITKVDSPISKKLLDIENKDITTANNYFDIDLSKNDTISFIPDRKAQEILTNTKEFVRFIGSGGGWLKHSESNASLFENLGYVPEGEVYKPNSSETGEVVAKVTSETSGKVYCWVKFTDGQGVYNQEKLTQSNEHRNKVWSSNRQEIKVGRAVRALIKAAGITDVLDKDYEAFVNSFKATIDKLNDKFSYFDIIKGGDIHYWYQYANYYERKGTLGSSCMASARPSWLEIYTNNPEQVSLVIFKSQDDTDKIVGRALLWTLTDGKKFLDRIYAINDSDVQLFRDYAKENDWYSKSQNNSGSDNQAYSPEDGTTVRLNLTVKLSQKSYNNYPYLDTLKYLNENTGIISNQNNGDCLTLEDTGGGHSDSSCDYCNGDGENECGECYGSGEASCSTCDSRGQIECNDCEGSGEIKCSTCEGSGEVDGESCSDCDGDGESKCSSCDGDGENECDDCGGRGEVDCDECRGRGNVSCHECS